MERANFPTRDKSLELRFIGRTETEQAPRIALYTVEKGTIRKVASMGDKISLAQLAGSIKEGTSKKWFSRVSRPAGTVSSSSK